MPHFVNITQNNEWQGERVVFLEASLRKKLRRYLESTEQEAHL